ncbi:MAG: hypothetical protein LBD01_01230 [Puniceicoccales bacterium]|jgi:hypothetical protein|nr:hypothetical protein [Puniceicoccales bacterium]
MNKHLFLSCSFLALTLQPFGTNAHAADAFSITLTKTGSGDILQIGGKTLPDLARDAVRSKGLFADFDGLDFSGSLDYLGVRGAITIEMVANSATVEIPSIGFSRVFTGTSHEAAYDKMEDFFTKESSEIYGKFLRQMARRSIIALTDGNPMASTARTANSIFFSEGFTHFSDIFVPEIYVPTHGGATASQAEAGTPADAIPVELAPHKRFGGIALDFSGGSFKAGDFKGNYAEFAIPMRFRIARPVDLSLAVRSNYLEVEGAQAVGIGFSAALPIHIFSANAQNFCNWTLAPFSTTSATASWDLGSGGLIWATGAINTLDFRINKHFAVSLINQISYHKSVELSVNYDSDEYKLDPGVSQWISKNGLRLAASLGESFQAEAYAVETFFLKETAVKDYTTLGLAFNWQVARSFGMRLGGNYDFASDYSSFGANFRLQFKF